MTTNVLMDLVADGRPSLHRPFNTELLDGFHRTIKGDPCHDLRVGEMLARPAHFPDAFVGLAPRSLKIVHERLADCLRTRARGHAAQPRLEHGVRNLAKDIELQLR